jgi:two-component system, cell cycle response regulator DivK
MRYKALVIDDSENNRLLEKDLLEVAGFEVLEAENAATGIALARKELPDVIVMDVRLPDMLGTDAALLLRQGEGTKDIPIVFVTASVMADGMEKVRAISNSGFISKPIDTRSFAAKVAQFMQAAA